MRVHFVARRSAEDKQGFESIKYDSNSNTNFVLQSREVVLQTVSIGEVLGKQTVLEYSYMYIMYTQWHVSTSVEPGQLQTTSRLQQASSWLDLVHKGSWVLQQRYPRSRIVLYTSKRHHTEDVAMCDIPGGSANPEQDAA